MSPRQTLRGVFLVVAVLLLVVLAWPVPLSTPAAGLREPREEVAATAPAVSLPATPQSERVAIDPPDSLARLEVLVRREGSHGHPGSTRVRVFALAEGMQEREVAYSADLGCFCCTGQPGPHVVVVTERWSAKCRRIELSPGVSHFGFPGSPYPATLRGDVYVNVRWPSGYPVSGAAVELVGPGRAMRTTSSVFGDAVFREVPLADGLTNVVRARLDDHHASVMLPAHDGVNPIGTFYPLTLRDRVVRRVVVGDGEFTIRKGEIDLRRAESATPMHVIPTPIAGGTFDLVAMPGPFVVGFTPEGEFAPRSARSPFRKGRVRARLRSSRCRVRTKARSWSSSLPALDGSQSYPRNHIVVRRPGSSGPQSGSRRHEP